MTMVPDAPTSALFVSAAGLSSSSAFDQLEPLLDDASATLLRREFRSQQILVSRGEDGRQGLVMLKPKEACCFRNVATARPQRVFDMLPLEHAHLF